MTEKRQFEGMSMMSNNRRNMKHAYYVIYEKTVHLVEILCNLVAILENQSDHIDMLIDKMERMKEAQSMQQESGSENNAGNKTMRDIVKECMPMKKRVNNKYNDEYEINQTSVNKENAI